LRANRFRLSGNFFCEELDKAFLALRFLELRIFFRP